MEVRQFINEHPKQITIGAAVAIALALVLIIWSLSGGNDLGYDDPPPVTKIFYTDDDGQSTFLDIYDRLGQADFKGPHGGEAVQAFKFRYSGEKPFVGYMVNYTPEGKRVLADFYSNPTNKGQAPPAICESQKLMKRPGQPQWLGRRDPGFFDVPVMAARNGKPAQEVAPG